MVDRLVAGLPTGSDVVPRVVEVAGVRLIPVTAVPVAREDPVLCCGLFISEERARRGQVGAEITVAPDLAAAVASVPPDLVARVARSVQVVADGQVLDPDIGRLPDHHTVQAKWPTGCVGP